MYKPTDMEKLHELFHMDDDALYCKYEKKEMVRIEDMR